MTHRVIIEVFLLSRNQAKTVCVYQNFQDKISSKDLVAQQRDTTAVTKIQYLGHAVTLSHKIVYQLIC